MNCWMLVWRQRCAAANTHAITMSAEHVNVSGGGGCSGRARALTMAQSNDVMKFYYYICKTRIVVVLIQCDSRGCIHVCIKWKSKEKENGLTVYWCKTFQTRARSLAATDYILLFVTIPFASSSFQLNNNLSALIRLTGERREANKTKQQQQQAGDRLNKPQLFSVTTERNIRHTSVIHTICTLRLCGCDAIRWIEGICWGIGHDACANICRGHRDKGR